MDPREKREDETWAEYGARIASMGIAPTESYFAGPTVNQFRPTGSDYTPQQLNTPIHQLQQQNIPQNVVPITPVDPTLAGMGTVGLSMIQEQVIPKTGHFGIDQNYGDFSPHMGALVDMVGNQPPAIDYGVVTDNPTRPYEPGIPFHQNMPTVTPSDQNIMPTIQGVSPQDSGMVPIGYTETTDSGEVVPMTNENLSFFGAAPIPTAPSMRDVDYSQALADAGMGTVATLPGRTPQAGYDKGPGDEFGGFDKGTIESIFDITKNTDIDFDDYWSRQEVVEDFLNAGLIDETQASQLKGHQLQQFNDFLTHMVPALTYEMIDEVKDSGAKGWKGLIDALSKGAIIGLENVKGANISAAGGDVGTQVDAAIELVNMGIVTPDEMRESIPEMVSQVDTFKDIPAAPAKPAGPTRAELKAAAAAQRKADLARQKAAARRTKLARQALKDSQAAAARAAAASAADKLAKEKAAKAVLARLSQDRNQPSAREVAKAREVLSQIDTFGTGGQRGFMGAEIGIEDGGGYTGGDFSSGAGWE